MQTSRQLNDLRIPRRRRAGFSLAELMVALGVVVVGFLGAYAVSLQADRLACSAEEASMVISGIEQRIDQLRLMTWPELTGGTNATFDSKVWTQSPATSRSHPEATLYVDTSSGTPVRNQLLNVTKEEIVIEGADVATQKVTATLTDTAKPPAVALTSATTVSGTGAALSTAKLLKITITITWNGPRPNMPRVRSMVTYIAKGGMSKYAI